MLKSQKSDSIKEEKLRHYFSPSTIQKGNKKTSDVKDREAFG